MTASPPLLLSAHPGGVLRLILNRPSARNALSSELMAAMQAALDGAARDDATRVIVIAAEGPVFSSGHDLKELAARRGDKDKGAAAYAALFTQCSAMMQAIVRNPKPVIAQVQGIATAAGCQLVASCDLAIASSSARFATPGVNIGLFCSTPMVALTRAIGRKRAMEMLLTARQVPAREAAEWGLVNRVVPGAQLAEAVRELAGQIAANSDYTVALGKRAFYEQIDMPQEDAYRFARGVMERNAMADVAQEEMRAFLEKRVAGRH